jgi:hypothetical protein
MIGRGTAEIQRRRQLILYINATLRRNIIFFCGKNVVYPLIDGLKTIFFLKVIFYFNYQTFLILC